MRFGWNLPPTHRNRLFVEWIGPDHSVLELGCSTGFISQKLREMNCRVVGLEYDPEMAQLAERFCERVIVADLNKRDWLASVSRRFDVIALGDVLEHLLDPQQVLEDCRPLLAPNGRIIVSLPNVAFISNRLRLLFGKWDYTETGILDRTHLKFFTRKTANELFAAAGFKVIRFLPITGIKGQRIAPQLCQFLTNCAPTLCAFQLLFELKPN